MREPSILAVDDELENVELLERTFAHTFDFVGTTDPAAAIEHCMARTFDVIIVDQRMPGMTGTELLKQILGRQPKSFRVLLTGYSDLQATIDAINEGHVHRYLAKPFDAGELQSIVAESLQLALLDQQVQQHYLGLQQRVLDLERECERLRARLRALESERTHDG